MTGPAAKTLKKVLPLPYWHVIFSFLHEVIPLAQNPTVVYNVFFRAISEALLTTVSDTSDRAGD